MTKPLCLGVILLLFVSHAPADAKISPQESAARLAEVMHFASAQNDNFSQWLSQLRLAESQKTEIANYLKARQLESAALPKTSWEKGSDALIINADGMNAKLKYVVLADRVNVVLNTHVITMQAGEHFADLVKRVSVLLRETQTANYRPFELLFSQASAGLVSDTAAKISAWISASAESAMNFFYPECKGYEVGIGAGNKSAQCFFKDDASMLKADLGIDANHKYNYIANLACDKDQGKIQITYSTNRGMDMNYEKDVIEISLDPAQHPQSVFVRQSAGGMPGKTQKGRGTNPDSIQFTNCTYFVQKGAMAIDEASILRPANGEKCEVQSFIDSENHVATAPTREARRLNELVNFPIDRLASCCADTGCRNEFHAKTHLDSSLAPANHSRTSH